MYYDPIADTWERTPEQLRKAVDDDYLRWERVVKTANIRAT